MRMAPGGLHPSPAGTPKQVADVFQQWVEEADVDGFKWGTEKAMNVDRVPVEPVSDVPVVLARPLTLRAASGQRTGL